MSSLAEVFLLYLFPGPRRGHTTRSTFVRKSIQLLPATFSISAKERIVTSTYSISPLKSLFLGYDEAHIVADTDRSSSKGNQAAGYETDYQRPQLRTTRCLNANAKSALSDKIDPPRRGDPSAFEGEICMLRSHDRMFDG